MDYLSGDDLFKYEREKIEQNKNNKVAISNDNSCFYIGKIDKNGYFTGPGLMRNLKNRMNYEGEFKCSKPSGNGNIFFSNGEGYKGELNAGRIDGKGQFTYKGGEIVDKGDFIMCCRQIESENSIYDYDDVKYFQVIMTTDEFMGQYNYNLGGDYYGLHKLYLLPGDENPIAQNDKFGIIKFISELKYDNIAVKIVTHGSENGNNFGIELNDIIRIIENLNNQTGKLIVIFASCHGGGLFKTLQSDDCLVKVSNVMQNKQKLHTFSIKVAKEKNLCYNVFAPNKNVITSQYNLSTEDIQGKPPGIYDLDEVKFIKNERGVEPIIYEGLLLTEFEVKQTQRPTRHVTEPIRKLQQQLEHPSDNRRPISQILGSFRDQQLQM